jgi:hypothetical protein
MNTWEVVSTEDNFTFGFLITGSSSGTCFVDAIPS